MHIRVKVSVIKPFLIIVAVAVATLFVSASLSNPSKVYACGNCACLDFGPGPRPDGGKYGIWCTYSCNPGENCTGSCPCGNPVVCTGGGGGTPSCGGGAQCASSDALYDQGAGLCSTSAGFHLLGRNLDYHVGPDQSEYSNVVEAQTYISKGSIACLGSCHYPSGDAACDCTTAGCRSRVDNTTMTTVSNLFSISSCTRTPQVDYCLQSFNSNDNWSQPCSTCSPCGVTSGTCTDCCCGNACLAAVFCARTETAVAPARPASVYICVGHPDYCTELSQVATAPTIIPKPSAGQAIYFKQTDLGQPTGSRGAKYSVRGDNTTLGGWNGNCSTPNAGDFCSEWNTASTTPDLVTKLNVNEGTNYHVWAKAIAINACDDNLDPAKVSPQTNGYFKIDHTPQVVSITPSSGISGTEPNTDNGTTCSDNNPQTYTATYRDADGCSDIHWASLWIDDQPVNNAFTENSLHASMYKGSYVKVYAEPQTSGTCASNWPILQVYVDNVLVKSHVVSSKSTYEYYSNVPLSAGRVKLRMGNDCTGAAGSDTNVLVYKIKVNGQPFSSTGNGTQFCINGACAISTRINLMSVADELRYSGSVSYGANTYTAHGVTYDPDDNFTCPATGTGCYKNYDWDAPANGVLPSGTADYISTPIPGSYSDTPGSLANAYAKWRTLSATCSGTDLTVTYEVTYQHSFGTNLNLYGLVRDLAGSRSSDPVSGAAWVDKGDWIVDLQPPTPTVSTAVQSKTTMRVSWNAADANGIIEAFGTVGLFNVNSSDPWYAAGSKTITNTSSAPQRSVNLPVLTPDQFSLASQPLWYNTGVSSGANNINIGSIDDGELRFKASAVDGACNLGSGTQSSTIGSTWMITKAGSVYSGGSIDDPVVNYGAATGLLPNPTAYSWGVTASVLTSLPIDKMQTQISTELLSAGTQSINKVLARSDGSPLTSFNPFVLKSYSDTNSSAVYDKLLAELDAKTTTKYVNVSLAGATMPTSTSASGCSSATQPCVVKTAGNLAVGTAGGTFTCDREAVIFVNGNLDLNNEVKHGTGGKHGCIFVVRGDVIFRDGTNRSAGSPYVIYDPYQLFVIADGKVTFERASAAQTVSDGIKIDGSVIALGGATNDPSVQWLRSLQLMNNNIYPSVAMHLDPRYIFIAPDFFESNFDAYVKELGYKPY